MNLPTTCQRQTLYIGSLVLNSCQSMHMGGPRKQTEFLFRQLGAQCDELFAIAVDYVVNFTK